MQILTALLDLIFPPRESDLLLRCATAGSFSYTPLLAHGCLSLLSYQNPTVRAAILENKFYHNKTAARLFAAPLHAWLNTRQSDIILIPIPLGPKRLRERGHNQVVSILTALHLPSHVVLETTFLKRPKDTIAQTSLQKAARLKNITHAFTYTGPVKNYFEGKSIVIIDDVCTTGATLQAARMTLLPYLPENVPIHLLAIAH